MISTAVTEMKKGTHQLTRSFFFYYPSRECDQQRKIRPLKAISELE